MNKGEAQLNLKTELQTERLLLRPWKIDDVATRRRCSSMQAIRTSGRPLHGRCMPVSRTVRGVIRNVLSTPETYAVVLKETGEPIGSIGLAPLSDAVDPERREPESTREIGYWIGEPYWGQGLIPEAGREILHHGFEDLQLTAIWGVHDVNNHKSSRVMDKLGLAPVRTARHVHLKLLGDVYRDELVRRITADEWLTR